MEANQETIDKITTNFEQIKNSIDKLEGIIEDLKNCKSDYSKTILISAVSKVADSIGLKEKLIGG